jgi:hypothetical protein
METGKRLCNLLQGPDEAQTHQEKVRRQVLEELRIILVLETTEYSHSLVFAED